ncbi:MAG: hypothetical protein EXR63_02855 [Dehalococcoidia bacterium]|nr:hypothetical protein [Dehalococcoidia bacterium]
MRNPRSAAERTFTGGTLFDYAVAAGLVPSRMGGGGLADGYVLATAADGQRVVVALAELWPSMASKPVLLAYEQDGAPVRDGVRLIVTGDQLSGRSLGGVVALELRRAQPASGAVVQAGGLALGGLIERPGVVDAAALGAQATVEVETAAATGHGGAAIAPRRYRGARLYDLLDGAGIRLDAAVNEDFLSKVAVATTADGRAVVIAGGEIEPRFMAGDVIIATERSDASPAVDGSAEAGLRLVVPFDRKPGRWAKQLVSIELREG